MIRSITFSAFLFSVNNTMDNFGKDRLADISPPAIRRRNIGIDMTDEVLNLGTLPDMGNHRQSRTQEIGSSNYGD